MIASASLRFRRISERTKDVLAAKRARCAAGKAEGFALAVAPIIAGIVASGNGTEAGIAEALNARGIATARGGNWFAQPMKTSGRGRRVSRRKGSPARQLAADRC